MKEFCRDKDLLNIEPVIYLGAGPTGQQLAAGYGGMLTATSFASADSNFHASALAAGMVLTIYGDSASEGFAAEIISIDSATELTVSVPRAHESDPPVPPPSAGGNFLVRTYRPQIAAASALLAEKLRHYCESSGINSADFADSMQLRQAAAMGALWSIFTARAQNNSDSDANWAKAQNYAREFARHQLGLRLAVDVDGDGYAEKTRTLGNVTLRRV